MALVVILAIALIYYLALWLGQARDGFASQRAHEVYDRSRAVFEKTGGKATFSEYKTVVPAAEAVLYTDARNLWKRGELSPEKIQEVL